jgi:alcohol dehydrogenase
MLDRAEQVILQNYMKVFKAVTSVLPVKWPTVFEGPGSSIDLMRQVAAAGHRRVLVVTDAVIAKLGLLDEMLATLDEAGVTHVIYDGVEPDPTVAQIEAGFRLLEKHDCQAIVAVGGGSPIDAAKLIGARAKNRKPVLKLAGLFRAWRGMLPLYAVPTTAGTGSEVTIVAVMSDTASQRKRLAMDLQLMPTAAALDGALMKGLPPHVTAATGMDALTHAVEAFISRNARPATDALALEAIGLILGNLEKAYADGSDLEARQHMARASHVAGIAFTQVGVGYVHAIAHNFGARYHTPHGVANAIVMPHVLDYSLPACADRLATIARACGVAPGEGSDERAAEALIARIRELKATFGIPERLADLRARDIPAIARAARAEARFLYAVPRYLTQPAAEALIRQMLPADEQRGAPVSRAVPAY